MTRDRAGASVGVAVLAVAVVTVLGHFGSTLTSLSSKGSDNDSYDALGRTIAAGDTLNIDNAWTVAALQTVRPGSTYAVVLPSRDAIVDGRLDEITYDAIPPYMRYLLLPAVPAPARTAKYVLCYSCGRSYPHVRWVWESDTDSEVPGLKVGVRAGS